jgi:type VI secretion system secreted protein Hcp
MASDYLLEIDGIKGEAQDADYPGSIEVSSFSWGVTNPGSYTNTGGPGTGRSSFQDLHFTASVNKASPALAKACATGQYCKDAKLHVSKSGAGDQQEYYTIILNDVLVSSYQTGGSEGSNTVPTDQFSLNFAKIEFDYLPQKNDGSLDTPVIMKYELAKTKGG